MPNNTSRLLLVIDIVGTAVFAMEGAMAGINAGLDVFGIVVLSFVTAVGGGIIRDLLIGAIPPAAIRDWRYTAIACVTAGLVCILHGFVFRIPVTLLMVLDAAGLGLFAIAGAEKALEFKIHPYVAIVMGTITGCGGGTVRDLLLAQVPMVLRSDIYATAALAGSAVMIAARKMGLSPTLSAVLGGVVCFTLRVVAVWRHWNLPRVGP